MLLGFLAGFLNKYIGAYFENIDASQLTGSLFGGGVTFNNLQLRASVFESLGIPFHVIAGNCGTLEVKYSLTRLYSEPMVVTVKDLHILVVPSKTVKYDIAAEWKALQQEKMRQLEVYESVKHHLSNPQDKKEGNKGKGPEVTYFDTWVMQVLRNIKVEILSVHIRYEDEVTKKHEPFGTGIFLQKLTLLTTDAAWKSLFLKDNAPETIFKLLNLSGFAVYWNPSPIKLIKKAPDLKTMFLRLAKIPETKDPHNFKYLLEPMSMEMKVQLTPFPDTIEEPFSKPKVLAESSLNQLVLKVSDRQIRDILPFMDSLDDLVKMYKFRKHRPIFEEPIYEGHYKDWWRFAYKCILEDIERRRNNFRWSVISEHRQKCQKYLKAYYSKKAEKKSTRENELTIKELEKELDLFNLIRLRKQADLLATRQREAAEQEVQNIEEPPPPPVIGYYAWLMSWWMTPSSTPSSTEAETQTMSPSAAKLRGSMGIGGKFSTLQLTFKEKEAIQTALIFANNMDIVSYPDDYIETEANILLNEIRLIIQRIGEKHKETVLDGKLERVSFSLRVRPIGDGLQAEVKMGRVEAYGGDFPGKSLEDLFTVPQIITTANPDTKEYFFKFLYEKSPLGEDVDHKMSLEGLALQFTYHGEAIDKLMECFVPPTIKAKQERVGANIPVGRVVKKVLQFKKSPTSHLLRLMENQGKVAINLCLITPYIIIPQDVTGKSNFLVVQLGEINVVGTVIGGTLCEEGVCARII